MTNTLNEIKMTELENEKNIENKEEMEIMMTKTNIKDLGLVEEKSVKELKGIIKEWQDSTGQTLPGYWKMNKDQLIKEIKNIYADFVIEEKNELEDDIEVKNDENENEDVKPKKEKKVKDHKFIYKAYDPEGNLKLKSYQLKEIVDFSMNNGIASRGWVNLSIRRNIPVSIGLGYDQELTEDFVPRTTSKYSGNGWKFIKEKVEINEDSNKEDDEK